MSVTPPRAGNHIHTQGPSSEAINTDVQVAAPPESSQAECVSAKRFLVVDLVGDESAARGWATKQSPGAHITVINKADLKKGARLSVVGDFRRISPTEFGVFTTDLAGQSRLGPLLLLGVASGASVVFAGDPEGRALARSRLRVLLLDAPAMLVELLLGYGLIVPISWLLTVALPVLAQTRKGSRRTIGVNNGARTVLYVRALPVSSVASSTGGMPTHVAGFVAAAGSLGHSFTMLTCGLTGVDATHPALQIRSSNLFSATRALFELWNNLFFSWKSLRWLSADRIERAGRFDFIYQRYSRFNSTGVILSAVAGLPLLLEVNGSEVWVSRNWDPVGQLWLLKRFERLNLRQADVIFTVSEVERRKLMDAGAEDGNVVVNPNGVDAELFRPGCGGDLLRRQLGIDSKVVIGFTGTFGPWHGTEVLAHAATILNEGARFHMLFVGDGDLKPATKAAIETARNGVTATFTGRIPHSEVPAHLDACDILVSPTAQLSDGSEFFGSPTKLFEYLAMAKPVIASRVGQIADVITDGETGLLVEPGDARALASSIERVAGDPGLAKRIGEGARRSAIERHTWTHNAVRVFAAFESLNRGVGR